MSADPQWARPPPLATWVGQHGREGKPGQSSSILWKSKIIIRRCVQVFAPVFYFVITVRRNHQRGFPYLREQAWG